MASSPPIFSSLKLVPLLPPWHGVPASAMMHPEDMRARGLRTGAAVLVEIGAGVFGVFETVADTQQAQLTMCVCPWLLALAPADSTARIIVDTVMVVKEPNPLEEVELEAVEEAQVKLLLAARQTPSLLQAIKRQLTYTQVRPQADKVINSESKREESCEQCQILHE